MIAAMTLCPKCGVIVKKGTVCLNCKYPVPESKLVWCNECGILYDEGKEPLCPFCSEERNNAKKS